MKEVAVILGSGLGALGALRAVSRLGMPCFCYDDTPGIESASRWYRALPDSGGSLMESLLQLPFATTYLIPASDPMARFAAALQESRPERFAHTLPKVEVIDQLINKSSLRAAIERVGVPHPRTFEVKSARDIARIPQGDESKYFLRPGDPNSFGRIFGVRGLHPKNREQLETFTTDILKSGFTISAQEIVPGPPSSYVYLDGVFEGDNYRALFARQRLRMFPSTFGVSSSMVSILQDRTLNAATDLRRFFQSVGFRGLFCAEFKIYEGEAKLLEIIPRSWMFIEHSSRCGLNLIKSLTTANPGTQTTPPYRTGFKMMHLDIDLKAQREQFKDNWAFARAVIQEIINSQHFLLSPDDPLPGIKSFINLLVKGIRGG